MAIEHEVKNGCYNLIRVQRLKELFPDAQFAPDFIKAFEDAVYILAMKANDRRQVNRRTRFFACDV